MRVMLVDDEEWCLIELREILMNIVGIKIIGTYSLSADALEAAIRDGPDIIFMDVQMPGINGLDLAAQLRRQEKKIYIVLMSEHECFARNGFDIGVDDYILKPLKKDRIIMAIYRANQDDSEDTQKIKRRKMI